MVVVPVPLISPPVQLIVPVMVRLPVPDSAPLESVRFTVEHTPFMFTVPPLMRVSPAMPIGVPLQFTVPPLMTAGPPPVIEMPFQLWTPPETSSVAGALPAKLAVLVPPDASLRVAVCTFTRLPLLNATKKVVMPVPGDLVTVPLLLNCVRTPFWLLSNVLSFWMLKVAPAWLLNTAPSPLLMVPVPAQVVVPLLVRVRWLRDFAAVD